MKKALRLLAGCLLLGVLAYWLARGAHRGWTKTTVPVISLDETTGLEAVTYQAAFIPGLDFLGAGAICSAAVFGFSMLFNKTSKP